jgi:hypothetical protein
LLSQDYAGGQRRAPSPDLQQQITQLGLDYRLMTQFTSFVAVEEIPSTPGGRPARVEVPVNIPEGVSYEGVFGRVRIGGNWPSAGGVPSNGPGSGGGMGGAIPPPPPAKSMPGLAPGSAGGFGGGPYGVAGGVVGGVPGGVASAGPSQISMSPGGTVYYPPTQKLDPALVAKLQAADKTAKIKIQILLSDASPATMEQLRKLGFEVLRAPGRDLQVTGRIAIEKLTELSQLQAVRYIVPRQTAGR